jgi:Arc/MetJ-type ribon-helix-helix transcriptional regulator
MDEIIQIRISEEEKKIMDLFIKEKKFTDHSEFIQESIRHYLFTLIEEKLDTIRIHSTMTIEDINESAQKSRNHIFQEIFSDEGLFG